MDALPAEDVLRCFPKPSFRAGQREALLSAAQALRAGKAVQMEAPVGSGKSPMAIALGRWAGGALVTTPLNSLVDQYERDFGGAGDIAVIKGKDNYACDLTGGSASTAPCTYDKQARKACKCPFAQAKAGALAKPIVVTSLAMAMTAGWLPDKALVIVDEAHGLEASVARQVAPEFSEADFDLPPEGAGFDAHLAWMKGAVEHARARFEALDDEVGDWAYDARKEGKDPWAPPTLVKARDHWHSTLTRMVEMQLDAQQHGEPWVVQEARGRDGKRRVRYVPVTGRRFLQEKLLGKGKGVVLMTATPPTAHEVGLDERPSARVTMPLRVPRERRPVVLDYVGSMSLEQRKRTMPRMAQAVARHTQGKTIVHAHAHKLARALSDELKLLGVRHVLQDPEDREGSLRAWMRGLEEVFVSVRMNEGLDLRDDLCRTQLLAKMPWPDLGDPWVQARNAHMGDAWMHREVARSIAQAYGRAVRSETDWANFVVLDAGFEGFWKRDKDLFPAWFREAVGLPKVVPAGNR